MTNLEKQQFIHHVRNISKLISNEHYGCTAAVDTLLFNWSRNFHPKLTCHSPQYSELFAAEKVVKDFLDWLCAQDFLNAAYWLSSAYSIWVGSERRKKFAMFFTPPELTRRLLDDLEQEGVLFSENSFFDPACGGAAFLAPLAARIKSSLLCQGASARQILEHLEQHLLGVDLDPVLCRLSEHFLRMVVADEIVATKIEPKFNISQLDSLKELSSLYGTIDVVLCNPPYRKMPSEEVGIYRNDFADIITAQPNLYGLFMALCLRLLQPQGIAALVTPTSFLSGRYFSKLRSHLMENAEVLHIGMVSDRDGVFINVEQETALTLLRRRPPSHLAETTTNVALISRQGDLHSVGQCLLPNSGCSWPIPRAEGDAELIRLIGTSKFRFEDYGYALRAGQYVWNRDPRSSFISLEQAQAAKAGVAMPLLWSSDIRKGGDVFFSADGKENDEPSFVDIKNSKSSTIVRRPSVLLQRVTSNDQSLRLVAAAVPLELFKDFGGFIGENHTVILEAKDALPEFPPELVVQLLGTRVVDRYFRCISGANNVSIFELSQLPLPNPIRFREALAAGVPADDAALQSYLETN